MKTKRTLWRAIGASAIIALIGFAVAGCDSPTNNNEPPPVNRTALNAAISGAEALLFADIAVSAAGDGSDVHFSEQWTTQDVRNALQSAIEAATAVRDNTAATQAQVDAAVIALNNAMTAFNNALRPGTYGTGANNPCGADCDCGTDCDCGASCDGAECECEEQSQNNKCENADCSCTDCDCGTTCDGAECECPEYPGTGQPGYHTVTFNLGGGTWGEVSQVQVQTGGFVSEPTANPTKTGYTFAGWFTAATGGTAFPFDEPITHNTAAFARWNPVYHDVTFVTNSGTPIDVMPVRHGQAITAMPTTTKANHTFEGWYTDSEFENEFGAGTVIAEPITLYARWAIITLTQNFSISFAGFTNPIQQITGPTLSLRAGGTGEIRITGLPADASVNWLFQGSQITEGTTLVGNVATLALDASFHGDSIVNRYVTVEVRTGGQLHSRIITFRVMP